MYYHLHYDHSYLRNKIEGAPNVSPIHYGKPEMKMQGKYYLKCKTFYIIAKSDIVILASISIFLPDELLATLEGLVHQRWHGHATTFQLM